MPWVYIYVPYETGEQTVKIKCTLVNSQTLTSQTTVHVEQATAEIPTSVVQLPSSITCTAGQLFEQVIVPAQDAANVYSIVFNWPGATYYRRADGSLVLRINPPAEMVPEGQSVTFVLVASTQEKSGNFTLTSNLTIARPVTQPPLRDMVVVLSEEQPVEISPDSFLGPEYVQRGAKLTIQSLLDANNYVTLSNGKIKARFPYSFISSATNQASRSYTASWSGVISWLGNTWNVSGTIEFLVYDRPAPYTVYSKYVRVEYGTTAKIRLDDMFSSPDPVPGYYTASDGKVIVEDGVPYLLYSYDLPMQEYELSRYLGVQYVDWYGRVWVAQLRLDIFRVPKRPYFQPFGIGVGRGSQRVIDLDKYVVNPDNVEIKSYKILTQGIVNYLPNWTVPEDSRLGPLPDEVRTGLVDLSGTGLNPPEWAQHGLFLIRTYFFGHLPPYRPRDEILSSVVEELQS